MHECHLFPQPGINILKFTKDNMYLPFWAFQTLERYENIYEGTHGSLQTSLSKWKMVVAKVQMLYEVIIAICLISHYTSWRTLQGPRLGPCCVYVFILWRAHARILLSLNLMATKKISSFMYTYMHVHASSLADWLRRGWIRPAPILVEVLDQIFWICSDLELLYKMVTWQQSDHIQSLLDEYVGVCHYMKKRQRGRR